MLALGQMHIELEPAMAALPHDAGVPGAAPAQLQVLDAGVPDAALVTRQLTHAVTPEAGERVEDGDEPRASALRARSAQDGDATRLGGQRECLAALDDRIARRPAAAPDEGIAVPRAVYAGARSRPDAYANHPQPVRPIFEPEVPAEAAYWAAHHRRREVWVGHSTIKAILASYLAPTSPTATWRGPAMTPSRSPTSRWRPTGRPTCSSLSSTWPRRMAASSATRSLAAPSCG